LFYQYKKQQRRIQFELKKQLAYEVPVLTIDQCQGQEADIVILSLVQKPTRFLDKHRLNVALSRVRQKLYMLVDRKDFVAASSNVKWDCHLIAKDLLKLSNGGTHAYNSDSDSDDFGSRSFLLSSIW
jgi:superfamily I DNA and/or RNA helicase